MPTIKQAGYDGSLVADIFSGGLVSLAATTGKVVSAEQDNTSLLDLFDDLVLTLKFDIAPTANRAVEVYLLPTVDGTNYPDGSASVEPSKQMFVGFVAVRAVTTSQVFVLRGIALPPGKWKYLVKNTADQATGTTGCTLTRRPSNLQSV